MREPPARQLSHTWAERLLRAQVRSAFYRYAGSEDVGSFMRSLGFQGFAATNADALPAIRDDFRRAIR